MKYGILSTLEYGSGRIILFCSRFDNVFTGNNEQSPEFCRSCLQWVSDKTSNDVISVLTVTNMAEDGGYRVFDLADKVNVSRGTIEDLSNTAFINEFDVVCLFGLDNDVSPLIRLCLSDYVTAGGGLVVSDVHVDAENIELFDTIAPVYCLSAGVNFPSGRGKWTSDGVASPIYSRSFARPKIQTLNTISEYGFSASWSLLYVFDTSTDVADDEDLEEEVDGPVYLSSDYDISGDKIIGYFSGVYKAGILTVNDG